MIPNDIFILLVLLLYENIGVDGMIYGLKLLLLEIYHTCETVVWLLYLLFGVPILP